MIRKRLLPFRLLPASWGLRGEAYDLAEACYLYTDEDLERALARIRHRGNAEQLALAYLDIDLAHARIDPCNAALARLEITGQQSPAAISEVLVRHGKKSAYDHDCLLADLTTSDPAARAEAQLAIDLRHNRIDRYTHDTELVRLRCQPADVAVEQLEVECRHGRLTKEERDRKRVELTVPEGVEREIKLLAIDLRYGHLTQSGFDKQRATVLSEPWVDIVDHGFNPEDGVNGVYLEFDWNTYWIDYLRLHGYTGVTEQQVIEQWFADVCRAQTEAAVENPVPVG